MNINVILTVHRLSESNVLHNSIVTFCEHIAYTLHTRSGQIVKSEQGERFPSLFLFPYPSLSPFPSPPSLRSRPLKFSYGVWEPQPK